MEPDGIITVAGSITAIGVRRTSCYFAARSAILALQVIAKENRWRAVDRLHLDSSVFSSAAYRTAKHMLYLRFRSGELYRYFEVPQQN